MLTDKAAAVDTIRANTYGQFNASPTLVYPNYVRLISGIVLKPLPFLNDLTMRLAYMLLSDRRLLLSAIIPLR